MHTKGKHLLILFIFLFLGTGGIAALRSPGQGQQPAKQEAVMTERQKDHSKLFKGYGGGKRIRESVTQAGADIKVKRHTPLPTGESGSSPITLAGLLQNMACNADAIVIGTVTNQFSQLTEDEEFAFTDYEIRVEQTLKDNANAPIQSGITIARPGGTVQFDGHIVEAEDASFKPLQVGGRYLLFLQLIPTSGDYKSLSSLGSFQLSNYKVTKQTDEPLPVQLANEDVTAFLDKVRAAIGNP